MTFIFGMGMGPIGMLCTDTRMNLQTADGTWKRNDIGLQRFLLRDGSVLEVPPKKRKMRRMPCGWVAASSSSHLLSEAIFAALSHPEIGEPSDIYHVARTVLRGEGERLHAEFSNPDPYDRVNLIYLYAEGRQFRVGHCEIGQRDDSGHVSDYALSLPEDFDEDHLDQVRHRLTGALFVPEDAAALWKLARAAADIVYCVHRASESVSDQMDLVMLVRDAGGQAMRLEWNGRSSELREADDTVVSAAMMVSE